MLDLTLKIDILAPVVPRQHLVDGRLVSLIPFRRVMGLPVTVVPGVRTYQDRIGQPFGAFLHRVHAARRIDVRMPIYLMADVGPRVVDTSR
jgi:hypothetical protein